MWSLKSCFGLSVVNILREKNYEISFKNPNFVTTSICITSMHLTGCLSGKWLIFENKSLHRLLFHPVDTRARTSHQNPTVTHLLDFNYAFKKIGWLQFPAASSSLCFSSKNFFKQWLELLNVMVHLSAW